LLYGGGGTGELFERVTHMDTVADRSGFVVVYPDGRGRLGDRLLTWNAGACCAYAKDQNIDDVAFVSALVVDVRARLKTTKVFVTGFSNGACTYARRRVDLAVVVPDSARVRPGLGAGGVPGATPTIGSAWRRRTDLDMSFRTASATGRSSG
jgi:polyhydroxybutyrate depolymerase